MGKLKHNYNAFKVLRTRFFHKQCVIWSFPPSFNEFHHNLHLFQISGTILEILNRNKFCHYLTKPITARINVSLVLEKFIIRDAVFFSEIL